VPEASVENDVAILLAERDIRGVLARYCRGIDRGDYDLVRECYHSDAIDEHGDVGGPIDLFISKVEGNRSYYDVRNHFICNILIDLGVDVASTETYCLGIHRRENEGQVVEEMVVGVRYCDRFERRQGTWRIAHRKTVMDWAKVHDGGRGWTPFASYDHGEDGHADPAYGFDA
jgi:hypothetical protein